MNKQSALVAAALVGLFSAGAAHAADANADKEKCYGVAKAGQNDCASSSGSHSCAGQSKVDKDPKDWKFVAKGTCAQMDGSLKAAK